MACIGDDAYMACTEPAMEAVLVPGEEEGLETDILVRKGFSASRPLSRSSAGLHQSRYFFPSFFLVADARSRWAEVRRLVAVGRHHAVTIVAT
jgi:hypothetical protein